MGVMFHLRDRSLNLASSRAALDRLSAGVVLSDADGRVTFENLAARRLLDRADTLTREREPGAPHARISTVTDLAGIRRRLRQAVERAAQSLDDDLEHFSEALIVTERDGRPRLVIHVAPLSRPDGFEGIDPDACSIAFVYGLACASGLSNGMARDALRLTEAESRVAIGLFAGGDVADLASRLGISVPTARTHLRHIFEKAGVSRKSDLLKLLLALASVR